MNKKELLDKVKSLEGLSADEKAYLVNLVNSKKKYGLVWEDKPEEVEEQLRTHLPVLKEIKERAIINDTETEKHPNHILIEGDNLHALTSLTFTHEGKIDMIYIDPPYNTGNNDFIYHDAFKDESEFIDKEHPFRHSTWLSFMYKRLVIAKALLKPEGILFISIDDNELANLVLLCNEIFGEKNKISVLPTIMNLKGNQSEFAFAGTHEYTLVYALNKQVLSPNQLDYDPEELEKWEEDDLGYYKKGANLRSTGAEAKRENRPYMFYPILVKGLNVSTITEEEFNKLYNTQTKDFDDEYLHSLISHYEKEGYEIVLPIEGSGYGRWRWGFSEKNRKRLEYDIIVTRTKNGISLNKKQRPELGEVPSKKPKSIFYKPEYSSGNGTSQLQNIMGKKVFDNPKPVDLIQDFIKIGMKEDGVILDFFAGSGTTLDAVMTINSMEKRNIECLLVTNNENRIAEDVTYVRSQKLIQGYKDLKGIKKQGLVKNNLRYYKTAILDRANTLTNKRSLTLLSTELLCIKEACYTNITSLLQNSNWHNFFTNGLGNYVYIIYDDMYIQEGVDHLTKFIANNPEAKIKVYVFANGPYPYTEEFEDIAANIELAALPDAIYKAYQNILPKQNKEFVPELEEESPVEFEH